MHHDKFLDAAKQADVVLTTDINMIPSYKKKTVAVAVGALPFAAQPALHKPKSLAGRKARACFAGSWYGQRHKQRGEDMEWLLPAVAPLGLDIYDRNYGTGVFPFPDTLSDCVIGSLPYEELCDEYGRYRVFLNVNSVSDSSTMFSRRVFELLACGTPIISTYSKGIEEFFGRDLVTFVRNGAEAKEAAQALLHNDALWRKKSLAGIRAVFSNHTYRHRLDQVISLSGQISPKSPNDTLYLYGRLNTTRDYERFNQIMAQQTYSCIIPVAVVNDKAITSSALPPRTRVINASDMADGAVNALSHQPDARAKSYAGWIVPDYDYRSEDFEDLMNATRYAPDCLGWGIAADKEKEFMRGAPILTAAHIRRLCDLDAQPPAPSSGASVSRDDCFAVQGNYS